MLNQGFALICILSTAFTLPTRVPFAPLLVQVAIAHPAQKPTESNHGSQGKTAGRKPDAAEAEINRLLGSQVEAWNRGNLEGFMSGYWNSPDLEFYSGGTITKGWEPTLQRYQKRYQGKGNEMGKLAFQELEIAVLSGKAAVASGKWQLTMTDGKQPHGLFTLILKKMPSSGWKIVHDHTSSAE
jgi:beta-aspartyl-peptidase (threonine type)